MGRLDTKSISSRGLNMSDKVRKIIVRVLAIVLTMLMILGVCAQFVFAAEEEKAPTTKVTFSLKGLTDDFPHTEVLALVSNCSTWKSQSVLLRKDKNFTAEVDLEDGYYFIYSNRFGWKDQNNNTLVINNDEPYNFYIGNSFDKNKYPDQTFIQSKNISVPFDKVNEKIEKSLRKVVDKNTVVYWEKTDLIYPMEYIYNTDDFVEALSNAPILTEGLPSREEVNNKTQSSSTDHDRWAGVDISGLSIGDDNDDVAVEDNTTDSKSQDKENKQYNDSQIQVENENEESATESISGDVPEEGQQEEIGHTTFFGFIWQMILDSKLIIILLIVCLVGLYIIRKKNKEKILKQMENDSYDDSQIE